MLELEKMRDQVLGPAVLPPNESDGYPWEGGRSPEVICGPSHFDVTAQTGDRGQSTRANRTHAYVCNPHTWIRSRDVPSKLTETLELLAISLDVSKLT
jgi:hypothetical protein